MRSHYLPVSNAASKAASALASKRWAKSTKAERSAAARKAALARWSARRLEHAAGKADEGDQDK